MNAGTSGSRVVVLTELRMLFEERAIPTPTANRLAPHRRAPRATSRALAGAMNHLAHSPRASAQAASAPATHAPLSGALGRPLHAFANSAPMESLGTAAAAPIWAWSGVGSAARHAFTASPSVAAAPSAARPMLSVREPRATPGVATATTMAPHNSQSGQDSIAARAVHIPSEVLRAMAAEAARTGRRESELWAEAAREWLDRRAHHDDPPPAASALAPSPALRATRERCWSAIDILLSDLRAPDHAPMVVPALPAAATHAAGWDGWDGSAA